jgi:ketosteroid isomerase-like protein
MIDTPNARTEANRQTIRQAFAAWRQGTGAISEVFAPEMVWRIEGHSLASKEYGSKQQFIDEVLTPLGHDSGHRRPSARSRSARSTPTATP